MPGTRHGRPAGGVASQGHARGIAEDGVLDKVLLEPIADQAPNRARGDSRLAVFLASEDALSITGGSYAIDGGWTER